MDLMLLQLDLTGVPWRELGTAIGAVAVLFLILLFFLRVIPGVTAAWKEGRSQDKEVKLAEISVREEEAKARSAQAVSFGQLSEVIKSVAIEQKHSTDKVQILQRVNADAVERNAETNERNEEKLDLVLDAVQKLTHRVGAVEKVISQK